MTKASLVQTGNSGAEAVPISGSYSDHSPHTVGASQPTLVDVACGTNGGTCHDFTGEPRDALGEQVLSKQPNDESSRRE